MHHLYSSFAKEKIIPVMPKAAYLTYNSAENVKLKCLKNAFLSESESRGFDSLFGLTVREGWGIYINGSLFYSAKDYSQAPIKQPPLGKFLVVTS